MGQNKYNAVKETVDGIKFHSKAEADRYRWLKILERSGIIADLRRQVPFVLIPKSVHGRAVTYRADFVYRKAGREVIEDVKGMRLPVYKLKYRMMAELGHEITEVDA